MKARTRQALTLQIGDTADEVGGTGFGGSVTPLISGCVVRTTVWKLTSSSVRFGTVMSMSRPGRRTRPGWLRCPLHPGSRRRRRLTGALSVILRFGPLGRLGGDEDNLVRQTIAVEGDRHFVPAAENGPRLRQLH